MGQVTQGHPDRWHAGAAQQIPGSWMAAAVEQARSLCHGRLDPLGETSPRIGVVAAPSVTEVERGHAVRSGTWGVLQVQRDHEVCSGAVREVSPTGLLRNRPGRCGAGQQDLSAQDSESSLDPFGDRQADVGSTVAHRIEHDHFVGNPGAQPRVREQLAQFGRAPSADSSDESVEGTKRVRTAGAIGLDPDTSLEITQRSVGPAAENPVLTSSIESEVTQAALKFRDIVAGDQVTGNELEDSITELPPSLVQPTVRGWADDAIDRQPAFLLERADSVIELLVEYRPGVRVRKEAQVGKSASNLSDTRPGIPKAEHAYRYAARSASRACFGFAPTMDLTSCPP